MRQLVLLVVSAYLIQFGANAASIHHIIGHHLGHSSGSHGSHNRFCIYPTGRLYDPSETKNSYHDLLTLSKEISRHSEISDAMLNYISKTTNTISDFIRIDNSTAVLGITRKIGRMFVETTSSLAKVLKSADKLMSPQDRFDQDLMSSKLKLIETTRDTLNDFIKELSDLTNASLGANDNAQNMPRIEEVLIDEMTESHQIIFDSSADTLEQIAMSDAVSPGLKNLLAARVLASASAHLKSFANLRKKIHAFLLDVVKTGETIQGSDVELLHSHLKDELLTGAMDEGSEHDQDIDFELTPQEQKELEGLLEDYNSRS